MSRDDDRRDERRRRFEQNRAQTKAVIDGARTGDLTKARRALGVPPADAATGSTPIPNEPGQDVLTELQAKIDKARSLADSVIKDPSLTNFDKQFLVVAYQIAELSAAVELLERGPNATALPTIQRIRDLKAQLLRAQGYQKNLVDPSLPIHKEWKSK